LSAKYINQSIWNSSADAFALDLGMLFISDLYGVRIGAIHPNDNAEALNLGGEHSFSENVFIRSGYKSTFLPNAEEGLSLGISAL
jgi:hypothetical protein